ncbi:hypothetical protein CEP52_008825 [Fusarium oligoseptatum]|uniref:Major facilitator superfamily (MFS) profile domain-containing protein n=1 Tax=Fusarium oligoseptatum TaxID=2604345 RepID=A0A428TG76_9HYPO|nr:hypothetical protein CEP52_008825 [Fusarium oligoseptatum]
MGRSRHISAANRGQKQLPPFPTKQMFVLACCRICEPIAFMSIFPYIYYMIEDFNITDDSSKISVYAGMVTSAFTLAEFSTGVLWGRLSDKIGRKPVLLFGLLGTALSVLVFGFAPSLPVALFRPCFGSNIGVLQTTVAELVTVKEQQPRAYTIMPMVWCIGSIIGPMIGGALARPCISYPEIFARGTIWDRYPYLLPNLFSAATVFIGVVIGLLFLEETHAEKKTERDRGREIGDYLANLFSRVTKCNGRGRAPEKQALLDGERHVSYGSRHGSSSSDEEDELLPAYQSQESSPRLAPQDDTRSLESHPLEPIVQEKPKTFTKPVIMNIISYGILAFHTMTFDQLFPVFLSTARPEHPVHDLPFRFTDGFGLETKVIGFIMSVQGLYSLFSNYLIVAPVTRRLGSLRLFRLLAFFLLCVVSGHSVPGPPARADEDAGHLPARHLEVYLFDHGLPQQRDPFGQLGAFEARPTLSGLLYSLGLQTGYSGLAWWFSGLVTIVGAYLSTQITEGGPQEEAVMPEEEDPLMDEGLFTDYDGDDDRV